MIGSFRLPTHRRGAHRKFVSMIPSLFKIKILALRRTYNTKNILTVICSADNKFIRLTNL